MITGKYTNGRYSLKISTLKIKRYSSKSLDSNSHRTKKCSRKTLRNTDNPLSIRLDFLTVITPKLPFNKLNDFLEFCNQDKEPISIIDETFCLSDKSLWFEKTFISSKGIKGGFTVNKQAGMVDVMVCFYGQYFKNKTVVDTWRLITGLYHAYECHCSRIDIAIDDYTYQVIPVKEMVEATQNGDKFFFRKHEPLVKDGKRTDAFGSRTSDHYTRIYDHKGEFLRNETEFKGKAARVVFEKFAILERDWFHDLSSRGSKAKFSDELSVRPCEDEINNWLETVNFNTEVINQKQLIQLAHKCQGSFDLFLQKILGSIAVSAIDFRDRSVRKDRNKASCRETQRLGFYQEFIKQVGIIIRIKARKFVNDNWTNNSDTSQNISFIGYTKLEKIIEKSFSSSDGLKLIECLI